MMRSTAAMSSPPSAWKMALCSLSTGISASRASAQVRFSSSPAQTRLSLLASASTPPCAASREPRRQPGRADDRRHHPVDRLASRRQQRRRPGRRLDAAAGERQLQLGQPVGVGRDGDRGLEPPRLFGQQRRRCPPVSATTSKASAPPWASMQRDGVLADRPGRAEDADPSPRHLSCPNGRCRGCRRGEEPDAAHHPVEPVHHAAMPGDQPARVLHPEPPLHRRLQEVAELRADRDPEAEQADARAGASRRPPRPKTAADEAGGGQPAEGPGPGLARADRRPELRLRRPAARRNRRRRRPRPPPAPARGSEARPPARGREAR